MNRYLKITTSLHAVTLVLLLSVSVGTQLDLVSHCALQTEAIHVRVGNATQEYGSLQEAVEYAAMNYTLSSVTPTVCIPHGHHRITRQMLFHTASIVLTGSQGTVVECDYDPLPYKDGFDYTWHFNQSEYINIKNISFVNCPLPFRLIAVRNVTVRNCIFSNFSEAVFDLFNCESIHMERSLFHNNFGTGILFEGYRGNTGAVALGYNNYPSFLGQPQAFITECEFINNSALATSQFLTSERAVSNRVFTGRGGGLGVFIDESNQSVLFKMTNCQVVGNYARSFGGGIFLIINGYGTQHILNFERIEILSNKGRLGGAGVQLSYLSATDTFVPPHTVIFTLCNFENNVGISGGGIYILTSFIGALGMYFKLDGCTFTNNRGTQSINEFGAAVGVSLITIFQQRVTAERHDIVNCTFSGNMGRNGIVSIGYSPIRFSGTNVFRNNYGASVRIIGSVVDFFDQVSFINNIGSLEGALSLLSFGQMRMNRGLQMTFDGNEGRLGASITAATSDILSALSSLLYNSACFAFYEDPLVAPSDWEEVSVRFQDNTAVIGSALYLSRVGQCSWFSQRPPFFNRNFLLEWPIWKFENNTNTGYSDTLNPDHYVGTHARKLAVSVGNVSSWPGEKFQIAITGIDEFDQVTSTSARLFQLSGDTPSIELDPEIVVVAGSSGSGLLTDELTMVYSVTSNNAYREIIEQSSVEIGAEEPFEALVIPVSTFNVSIVECPGGYLLNAATTSPTTNVTGFMCQCLDIPEIVGCEDNQDSVIIKDRLWAGFVSSRSPNLFFHPCPPGYCQCTLNSSLGPERCVYEYSHSNPDSQCSENREGLLCGSCKGNKGVSVLLNRCVSCPDGYIAFLIALILCDIVVFVIVTLIDKPLPQWLYPFIFYVQLAPFLSESFPETFESVGVYMTYASNALGFYFIYDFCLLSHLPPLASYFLRYLPFITALIVCSSIRIIRKHCIKRKSKQHHGYWLIMLLLYPHLIHTSLSILNCPQIPDPRGSFAARWSVDASVQCFTGWHIPLALFSITVLLASLASITIVIYISIKKPDFIKKYVPPLTESYKQECKWWAGIDLGRRLLMLILLISFPRNTVYTTLLLVIILATYSYLHPYKSRLANAVEVTLLLNLIVLALLDATPLIRESLFTFGPGVTVSPINWLLFIFYYLPAVLLIGILIGIPLHRLLRRYIATNAKEQAQSVSVTVPSSADMYNEITMQSVRLSSLIVQSADLGEAVLVTYEPNSKIEGSMADS